MVCKSTDYHESPIAGTHFSPCSTVMYALHLQGAFLDLRVAVLQPMARLQDLCTADMPQTSNLGTLASHGRASHQHMQARLTAQLSVQRLAVQSINCRRFCISPITRSSNPDSHKEKLTLTAKAESHVQSAHLLQGFYVNLGLKAGQRKFIKQCLSGLVHSQRIPEMQQADASFSTHSLPRANLHFVQV